MPTAPIQSLPSEADCPFCRILAGTLPSAKLWEDEHTFAIMDIRPMAEGHALAIAKGHWPDLAAMPEEAMAAVARTAHRVGNAIWRALRSEGLNLHQANGAAAGQTVPHFHIHMIPRRPNDGGLAAWRDAKPADPAAIAAVAEKVRRALTS